MASLIPLMMSGNRQQIAATRGITLGDLTGEEMVMIHAMRRGRLQLPWNGNYNRMGGADGEQPAKDGTDQLTQDGGAAAKRMTDRYATAL